MVKSLKATAAPHSSKDNQHYVPRFWLRRFAGANGRLVATIDGVYQSQVDVDDIMSDDWIYTIFDPNWVSSDRVENDLAALEGLASALFDELHAGAAVPTDEQWEQLCWFLALQAADTSI